MLYQKLNNIVNKYSYIIENYGSLTQKEKAELYEDIKLQGFNLNDIKVIFQDSQNSYNDLKKLSIEYDYNITSLNIIKKLNFKVKISVSKTCYSRN